LNFIILTLNNFSYPEGVDINQSQMEDINMISDTVEVWIDSAENSNDARSSSDNDNFNEQESNNEQDELLELSDSENSIDDLISGN